MRASRVQVTNGWKFITAVEAPSLDNNTRLARQQFCGRIICWHPACPRCLHCCCRHRRCRQEGRRQAPAGPSSRAAGRALTGIGSRTAAAWTRIIIINHRRRWRKRRPLAAGRQAGGAEAAPQVHNTERTLTRHSMAVAARYVSRFRPVSFSRLGVTPARTCMHRAATTHPSHPSRSGRSAQTAPQAR